MATSGNSPPNGAKRQDSRKMRQNYGRKYGGAAPTATAKPDWHPHRAPL